MLIQTELVNYCRNQGIAVTAYSPLGSSPPSATGHSGVPTDRPSLMDNQTVKSIAENHKKSSAQILIKYHIQRGIVCIPKSITKERIEANANVFDFELSKAEIEKLEELNCGYRFCRFNVQGLAEHRDYPFKGEL